MEDEVELTPQEERAALAASGVDVAAGLRRAKAMIGQEKLRRAYGRPMHPFTYEEWIELMTGAVEETGEVRMSRRGSNIARIKQLAEESPETALLLAAYTEWEDLSDEDLDHTAVALAALAQRSASSGSKAG
jgi:hypothetical protein